MGVVLADEGHRPGAGATATAADGQIPVRWVAENCQIGRRLKDSLRLCMIGANLPD